MPAIAALVAAFLYGGPAAALITIPGGTTVTFAWDPAPGNVAGYYVIVRTEGEPGFTYSTVFGRNWETVTAEPNETISVIVVAFDAQRATGEASSPSEPVRFTDAASEPPPSTGRALASDLDGDGVSDLIVQGDRSGYLELMSMRSGQATLLSSCTQRSNGTSRCTTVKRSGKQWMIAGNGDYDGDGVADILLRRHRNGVQQYGAISIFFMDGDRIRESVDLATEKCTVGSSGLPRCRLVTTRAKKEWQIVGSGDYDGDGVSDVLLHNTSDNRFELWTMGAGGVHTSEILPDDFGDAAQVIASGDFDGDGMSDILWRDLASGDVDIWGLTEDSPLGPLEGGADAWRAMGAGDFDADGRDDVLLREDGTDRLAVRLSTSGLRSVIASPLNVGARDRQVPAIGDFDGDGRSDLLVYDGDLVEADLWYLDGSAVVETEPFDAPLDAWSFASVDLRPPGSR